MTNRRLFLVSTKPGQDRVKVTVSRGVASTLVIELVPMRLGPGSARRLLLAGTTAVV